ncbi:MAG: hypothetical protein V7785_09920 [Bermanella sp.]
MFYISKSWLVKMFSIPTTASLFLLGACSTSLKLPLQSTSMTQMTKVYLLKYSTWGHHSLAFYEKGILTEYTYGDWQLFALNKRDPWTAWKNMTFFTQGALGKKNISWQPGDNLCQKFKDCETAVPFYAPTKKVLALQNTLQHAYQNQKATEVYNAPEDVYFVKYPVSYWAFHNCNHELAHWLQLLGANVSGRVFYKPDFIGGMEPKQDAIP